MHVAAISKQASTQARLERSGELLAQEIRCSEMPLGPFLDKSRAVVATISSNFIQEIRPTVGGGCSLASNHTWYILSFANKREM